MNCTKSFKCDGVDLLTCVSVKFWERGDGGYPIDDEMEPITNVKDVIVTQVFIKVGTTKPMNTILGIVGFTTLSWWRFPLTKSMRSYLRLLGVKTQIHLKIVVEFMATKNSNRYF
jgi:hypothetical protein